MYRENSTPTQSCHAALISSDPKSTLPTNGGSHSIAVHRRVMTVYAVAALCFFNVSGGPIGSEPVFAAGGPAVGLVALCLFPFAWCIPMALVTAELSTAFPENGGFTVWVHHAFGPFWAFQEGLWFWLSGVIDAALYPSLAVTCVSKFIPELDALSATETWMAKAAMASLFALPNLLGIQLVGRGMMLLSMVVTLPFVVFSMAGFSNAASDWTVLTQVRHADTPWNATAFVESSGQEIAIQWKLLLTTVFWNCNGFANVSTFAGEVADPGKAYPRALLLTLLALELSYLVPLSAGAVFNRPPWWSWTEISFSDLAHSLGGNGLLSLMTIATLASNWGQFTSEMFCVSFQLTGMAESGLAPSIFAARAAASDVPYVSVAVSHSLVLLLIQFDLDDVMTTANVISAMYQVLLLAAAVKLRVSMPHVHRPYRVPGSIHVLIALTVLPLCVASYLIYSPLEDILNSPGTSASNFVVPVVLVAGGACAYALNVPSKEFGNSKDATAEESQRLA
ncbi:hypothetical protein H257_01682 [Aphanomyces astaci]|uniref:Amino acid permease/ SLC12A domain-containing protein n=2 Tax=Aphanomyces astaci TaxID=112090 RepID=W4H3M2_APHAT|nr:hypothetical protein H257_01682 [Aphanomyces astaci]ETV86502.1 hypothetical protein H257_01682 [Aphanomyces astaci]|eukprot:XP_009823301.1 hypothetical protein H257_01682 [Aphanomyces astaci]